MRMGGERCFKKMYVHMFMPDGKWNKFKYSATGDQVFTARTMDATLDKVAEQVEKSYPDYEFNVIQVGPNRFNFVYAGLKPTVPTVPTVTEPSAAEIAAI